KIGSSYSTVVEYANVYSEGKWFEVRASGNNIEVYYDNSLLGTSVVSDSELVNNRYHGIFSSGGTKVEKFFLSEEKKAKTFVWGGSSITINANPWAFRNRAETYLKTNFPQ